MSLISFAFLFGLDVLILITFFRFSLKLNRLTQTLQQHFDISDSTSEQVSSLICTCLNFFSRGIRQELYLAQKTTQIIKNSAITSRYRGRQRIGGTLPTENLQTHRSNRLSRLIPLVTADYVDDQCLQG